MAVRERTAARKIPLQVIFDDVLLDGLIDLGYNANTDITRPTGLTNYQLGRIY